LEALENQHINKTLALAVVDAITALESSGQSPLAYFRNIAKGNSGKTTLFSEMSDEELDRLLQDAEADELALLSDADFEAHIASLRKQRATRLK
jgi:hypothetical protein